MSLDATEMRLRFSKFGSFWSQTRSIIAALRQARAMTYSTLIAKLEQAEARSALTGEN